MPTSTEATAPALGRSLVCMPSRLTNLRTARLADMALAMRITQWLGQPAAAIIRPGAVVIVLASALRSRG